jgi:hypothetical protein
MKALALVAASVICILGTGLLVLPPDQMIAAEPYLLTTSGLMAIAAIRVMIGLVLILAAPGSRAPVALRALGVVVLVAGVATPFFGVDRSRAVADWAATHGSVVPRIAGALLLALGAFIAFVVRAPRRIN